MLYPSTPNTTSKQCRCRFFTLERYQCYAPVKINYIRYQSIRNKDTSKQTKTEYVIRTNHYNSQRTGYKNTDHASTPKKSGYDKKRKCMTESGLWYTYDGAIVYTLGIPVPGVFLVGVPNVPNCRVPVSSSCRTSPECSVEY